MRQKKKKKGWCENRKEENQSTHSKEKEEDKQMKEQKKTRGVGNGHSREGDFSKLVLTNDNERGYGTQYQSLKKKKNYIIK